MADGKNTAQEQVKEAGLGVQRAAKQDPSFGVGERAAAAAAKALDPGSGFPEKTLPEVQQAEKHRWEPPQYQPPFRGKVDEPVKYRPGADQEPHTMGVDKVQGMNQALGETNTFLTQHGRHSTGQGVGPYKPDELPQ